MVSPRRAPDVFCISGIIQNCVLGISRTEARSLDGGQTWRLCVRPLSRRAPPRGVPAGDGLPNLPVAAHARYDGHFSFKTDLHVIPPVSYLNIAQRIDV